MACWLRSSGTFLSRASPVHEMKIVGDAQRVAVGVLQDVRRAGDVPTGVTAGLEGAAQAAVGEARRVGLALQ